MLDGDRRDRRSSSNDGNPMLRRPALRRAVGALVSALALALAVGLAGPPLQGASAVPARMDEAVRGSAGIGDPYFPLDGNGGLDVLRYSVHDRYSFAHGRLSGWTRLEVRATQKLRSFHLDLLLDTSTVLVDGRRAAFRRVDKHELRIKPDEPVSAGERFEVVVRYDGKPGRVSYAGERNWLADGDEVVTMNEPHMAPWWFPANDHPLDKARFDIHVTVPRGTDVVSNGLPQGTRRRGAWTTHHWRAPDPMATYLAFFAAGDYIVESGRKGGLPWVNAVSRGLTRSSEEVAVRWLRKTPTITSWLEDELGDYPFGSTGGLVTGLNPGFALENQTRPTYPFVGGSATYLLVHELAHQWFGDSVSVRGWRDIWLNEGFASYLEARWDETHGGPSADAWLRRAHDQYGAEEEFWKLAISDPGPGRIFDGAVYDRGAMTLAALRNVIGDSAFARLLRTWVEQRRHGNAATEDFMALAEQVSGRDLDAFFHTWLVATEKPADTAANGLG